VRDLLRGIVTSNDYDYVVVGATPEQMEARGFRPVGGGFRVYLEPATGNEYALARRERKEGAGHRGFVIEAGPEVTLEEDLARRDLTVNAIAMDPDTGEIFDPCGGRLDLKSRILRAANPEAFADDPVRVLRLARFAATLGFWVEQQTLILARQTAQTGELENEPQERIYQEATRALTEAPSPSAFFRLLDAIGALEKILPELHALVGVPQPEHGHPEGDAFAHTMLVIDAAACGSAPVMWAALLHDAGKALTPEEEWPSHHGHEKTGLPIIEGALRRLRAPGHVTSFAVTACRHHMRAHRWRELRPGTVLRMISEMGGLRFEGSLGAFLQVFNADSRGRAIPADEEDLAARQVFFEAARVAAAGITGREVLGAAINSARRRGVEPKKAGPWIGDALEAKRIRAIGSIERAAATTRQPRMEEKEVCA
jgi:tRNA nucleotidyltransferase (CCA-adding enzyme)